METFFRYLLGNVLGLDLTTHFGGAVLFFVNDAVKVLLLLYFAVSILGILRSFISKEKMEKYLGSNNKFLSSFMAALLAIFTPFCSCSSIPIFLTLLKMRVPFSAAITFLAVSPLVNEYLAVLMPSYFGLPITLVYIFGGIFVGMTAGFALEKLGMASQIEPALQEDADFYTVFNNFKERIKFGFGEGADIVKKLWYWILAGVALGALIHNYVPDEIIFRASSVGGIFSVPLSALLGAPIYGSCAGVVPIALIFFGKAIPLGTTLAFLMAVSAMSLPEAVMLRGAMKLKLLVAFFISVWLGIVVLGYFMNLVAPYLVAV
ncbi:MAG: permease [Elusimicrobiota bacterium]|nr:permease [Elusimicrobiota bacterium]